MHTGVKIYSFLNTDVRCPWTRLTVFVQTCGLRASNVGKRKWRKLLSRRNTDWLNNWEDSRPVECPVSVPLWQEAVKTQTNMFNEALKGAETIARGPREEKRKSPYLGRLQGVICQRVNYARASLSG